MPSHHLKGCRMGTHTRVGRRGRWGQAMTTQPSLFEACSGATGGVRGGRIVRRPSRWVWVIRRPIAVFLPSCVRLVRPRPGKFKPVYVPPEGNKGRQQQRHRFDIQMAKHTCRRAASERERGSERDYLLVYSDIADAIDDNAVLKDHRERSLVLGALHVSDSGRTNGVQDQRSRINSLVHHGRLGKKSWTWTRHSRGSKTSTSHVSVAFPLIN